MSFTRMGDSTLIIIFISSLPRGGTEMRRPRSMEAERAMVDAKALQIRGAATQKEMSEVYG